MRCHSASISSASAPIRTVPQPLVDQRVHRRAAGAGGVGVADALGPVASRSRTVTSSKCVIVPWVESDSGTGSSMRYSAVSRRGDAHGELPPVVVARQRAPPEPACQPWPRPVTAPDRMSAPSPSLSIATGSARRPRSASCAASMSASPACGRSGSAAPCCRTPPQVGEHHPAPRRRRPARPALFRIGLLVPAYHLERGCRRLSARYRAAPVLHAQFARGGAAGPAARPGPGTADRRHPAWRRRQQAQELAAHRPVAALAGAAAGGGRVSSACPTPWPTSPLARGVPAGKLIGAADRRRGARPASGAAIRTAHLFVGRFVEKKGIAVLADAMRRLRAQGDKRRSSASATARCGRCWKPWRGKSPASP